MAWKLSFQQILAFLPRLLERNVEQEDIGIVSPYYAQVMTLKKELQSKKMKKIRIGTVEEFQGEEKKVKFIYVIFYQLKIGLMAFYENRSSSYHPLKLLACRKLFNSFSARNVWIPLCRVHACWWWFSGKLNCFSMTGIGPIWFNTAKTINRT